MKKKRKNLLIIIMLVLSLFVFVKLFSFKDLKYRDNEVLDFVVMPSPPHYKRIDDKVDIESIIEKINSYDKSFRGVNFLVGWSAILKFEKAGSIYIVGDDLITKNNLLYKTDKKLIIELLEIYQKLNYQEQRY